MSAPETSAQDDAEAKFRFPGRASDGDEGIEATGAGDATAAVLSYLGRAVDGRDVEVLRWHLFDHMPEQFRVAGLRNGQRWVSTPACRAARFASSPAYEAADYVVQYLFAEPAAEAITAFAALGKALGKARRFPEARQPILGAASFDVVERRANPRGALGAAALPWYPASGIFLTLETTGAGEPGALARLVETQGVAGAWRYAGATRELGIRSDPGQSATVFYLYDDPVAVAGRLQGAIEREWSRSGAEGLFAAPFYVVRPHDLGLRLP